MAGANYVQDTVSVEGKCLILQRYQVTFQAGLCARNLIIVNHLIIFLDAQEEDINHPFVPEWGHKTNSN